MADGSATTDAPTYKHELIEEVFKLVQDRNTRTSPAALHLSSEYLRLFTVEAIHRSAEVFQRGKEQQTTAVAGPQLLEIGPPLIAPTNNSNATAPPTTAPPFKCSRVPAEEGVALADADALAPDDVAIDMLVIPLVFMPDAVRLLVEFIDIDIVEDALADSEARVDLDSSERECDGELTTTELSVANEP
ncbi:hypothetical protein OIV83_005546 [Microbotryomycetes sp. JL201]|nr:hypothetical protein OIV83_005546 [Microbotryomycetes sp. JL201]